MKKKLTLTIIISYLLMLLASTIVFADDVKTTSIINEDSEFIYVAGNPDFYPVEFYNKNSGKYEGIMPEILKLISNKTGLKFAYVNSKRTQSELADNLQVEVISSYVIG
ncbi:MAG: transporter substrate-binding domain-containing protein, partial [Clostridia bacterium]|nr:transporter substrate-binding domain-containing protein [Clostridia bacterium]